jgi:hypothetical protein
MGTVFFAILMLISLAGYALVVALSVAPLTGDVGGRNHYIVFILYGTLFYAISTGIHAGLPILLFDTYFGQDKHRWKRTLLFVLPALMLAYMAYVIAVGS